MDSSDYEIIKICLSGNDDAFTEIVARYKRLVFNIIYNLLNCKSEASDLSQEAFLRIFKSLHRFKPEYQFSTWVIKITTNVCFDWMRQNKIDPLPMEYIPEAADNRSDTEEQYLKKEELTRIRKAISGLPEKYRVPVVLFHQQGLSYREMEEILNQPETIIKNRLYRARLMLKEKLAAEVEGFKNGM